MATGGVVSVVRPERAIALLIAMAAGAGASLYLLPMPVAGFAAALAILAVFIAAVDIEYLIVPDIANALLFAGGLALAVADAGGLIVWSELVQALLRAVVCGGAFLALRHVYMRRSGVEGLGLGDVKLVAAAAPWLAWTTLPIALLIASVGGLLAVAARALAARSAPQRGAEIPFGAFLAPAVWIALVIERCGYLSG
jgi:leader peptidase (prepilin peptidase)/N-methyltransferase